MIPKTVLPFKLETTDDKITPRAGLVGFGEYLHAIRLSKLIDSQMPMPKSPRGYLPSEFILPLVYMLNDGGRALEDLRELRNDKAFRELVKLDVVPSSDATGDWLRRMGMGEGKERLKEVNKQVVQRALKKERRKEYTLEIDATEIKAEKKEAKVTYKGNKGYMPILGVISENGLVLNYEFREGNESPAARNAEFIRESLERMPKGKKITGLRSDSAGYNGEVINLCEERGIKYAIGVRMDVSVKEAIRNIPEKEWRDYKGAKIAETVHSMEKTKKGFRLVVVRYPAERDLFGEGEERYFAVASNREERAEETVEWYNQRGETMENRIKEVKLGFRMERMPCGQFEANGVYFGIGVLAYNLFKMFKELVLPQRWRKHQVQTIRWKLYKVAGKVVKHGGRIYLKVARWIYGVIEEIRMKVAEALLE